MSRRENLNVSENVPVKPSETQYNRYNMTLPQSFSIYNNEGSVIYRGEVEQVANQLRAELLGYGQGVQEEPVVEPVAPVVGYTKKRSFFLVLPLIFAALVIALAVVSLFKTSFNGYIALYGYGYAVQRDIVLLDPVFSFLKTTFKMDLASLPTDFAIASKVVEEGNVFGAIAKYALPVAIVLYVVFALITLITSIVGLASGRREDGTYRKARLGFLSIVMFLCAVIIGLAGVVAVNGKIDTIVKFIVRDGILYAGYAYYALLAIPVLTFVCTCLAYGKNKNEIYDI